MSVCLWSALHTAQSNVSANAFRVEHSEHLVKLVSPMIAQNVCVREQKEALSLYWVICNGDQKALLHWQLDMQMDILIGHTPHAAHSYFYLPRPHFRVRVCHFI